MPLDALQMESEPIARTAPSQGDGSGKRGVREGHEGGTSRDAGWDRMRELRGSDRPDPETWCYGRIRANRGEATWERPLRAKVKF